MENFESDISQIIDKSENNSFIAQSYTDIKPLHRSERGAFELYRVNHFGKWIVLKALKEEYRNDQFFETILQKEFSIGHQISHKGIVATIDFINLPQIGNAIVLEYINGFSLREYIEDNAPLSADEFKRIVNEILDAVEHLHINKVIHRDLKPENIMIERNTRSVKIIDLGCADASDYNVVKGPAGTRHYAAPEQLTSDGEIDIRTDIYAIGKIILNLADNTDGRCTREIRCAQKCCNHSPADRYASIAELRKAFNRERIRVRPIIAIGVFVVIATGGGIVMMNSPKSTTPRPTASLDTTIIVQPKETDQPAETEENLGTPVVTDPNDRNDISHDTITLPIESVIEKKQSKNSQ